MGITSKIELTNATWNPWMGCHKVSQGCKNCYMYREQTQYGNDPNLIRRSKTTFYNPLNWREPKRIFTCSWSDFFIEDADQWRTAAWDIIRQTPQHTYQILTKRPENIIDRLPDDWGNNGWSNVWLGVSAENQDNADLRIPYLLRIPATIRFVSCEPLLGPINLWESIITDNGKYFFNTLHPRQTYQIDWIIVGGESGPNARTMNSDWVRTIRDQCQEFLIPFFFKQWGGSNRQNNNRLLDGQLWEEFPSTISEKSAS